MESKTTPTKQEWREIVKYKQSLKHVIATTRFNNYTWLENQQFRETHTQIGCIYPCPELTSQSIHADAILFILEMNNETNKIMGVGMVRNRPSTQPYRVYSNGNYNRYSYVGKMRIDRKQMTEEEDRIMKVFDILCFRGPRHMKRLQGIKSFPPDILYRCHRIVDLNDFISKMFKTRMQTNENK